MRIPLTDLVKVSRKTYKAHQFLVDFKTSTCSPNVAVLGKSLYHSQDCIRNRDQISGCESNFGTHGDLTKTEGQAIKLLNTLNTFGRLLVVVGEHSIQASASTSSVCKRCYDKVASFQAVRAKLSHKSCRQAHKPLSQGVLDACKVLVKLKTAC